VPYLGASFNVTFKDLFITANHTASRGRVNFITRKVDEWIQDEIKKQKEEALAEKQGENRDTWKGTDFYEKIIYYDNDTLTDVTADDGRVIVTTADGKNIPDPKITAILKDAPEKAIIIQDKNGDQWVVQKDKTTGETKITKVEGGGLSPTMDVVVSDEALAFVKKALTQLATVDYTDDALAALEKKLAEEQEQVEQNIASHYQTEQPEAYSTDNDDIPVTMFLVQDFKEAPDEPEDTGAPQDEFERLSHIAKTTELQRNLGRLARLLGNDSNLESSALMVAKELRSGNKTVSEYVADARENKISDTEIRGAVATLVKDLLINLLTASSVLKKENLK
jgi:hypothetical protein